MTLEVSGTEGDVLVSHRLQVYHKLRVNQRCLNFIGDSSGPNERAMESLPALAVDDLSIREAYRVERAVHFIGYVLDQENQRTKTGERVHRLLLEASRRRQAAGERYTAEELTGEFLHAFASRLSQDADWLRDRIIAYVDTEVVFRYEDGDLSDLRPPEAEAQRRAMAGYSHPRVEELEKHVLPLVPAFHVSGPLYDDLERSSWTTVRGSVVKTGLAFSIVVDGEQFVPLSMIRTRLPARNICWSTRGRRCG